MLLPSLVLALQLLCPAADGGGSWNAYGFAHDDGGSEGSSTNSALTAFLDTLQKYAGRAGGRGLEERGAWATLRLLGGSVGVGDSANRPIGLRDLGALQALSELSLLELTVSAEGRFLRVGNRSDLQRGTPEWRRELASDLRDLATSMPGEKLSIGAGYVALYWLMVSSLKAEVDGYVRMEGYGSLTQAWWLSRQAMRASVRQICEIGFNAGHSALSMLMSAPSGARMVSFDLGTKSYTPACASFIGEIFPEQFRLVTGSSRVTVPQYAYEHLGDERCDLIYIDGGHTEEDATSDLLSMSLLAKHRETLVVMDDIGCESPYCIGPTVAWETFKKAGRIMELGCQSEDYRGWCWGLYV